jgi:hypothetical protein
MDVIPLDADLVKGSHGAVEIEEKFYPVLITDTGFHKDQIAATDVFNVIWQHLTG